MLLLGVSIVLSIAGKGCPPKSRDTAVGSSIPSFRINAPSSLTVTGVSYSQINMTWKDNSNNEDGFEIERSLNGSNFQFLRSVDSNAYDDIGLLPSTTYYYRVRAFNTIGDRSGYSNEASATTFDVIWSAVAAYENHTFALTTNGTLWAWGQNTYGQLGLGDRNNRVAPNLIAVDFFYNIFEAVDIIATGFAHSIARKTDGTLWSCGYNYYGQLGLGDFTNRTTLTQIGTVSDWSTIALGSNHSLALRNNNTLWLWGRNEGGLLGFGDTISRNTPGWLSSLINCVIIAGGGEDATLHHSFSRQADGALWSWGNNDFGQLGVTGSAPRSTPVNFWTAQDSVIATNAYHSIARRSDGTLWSWGRNNYGQLGLGFTTAQWTGIFTPTQIIIGTDSDWSTAVAAGVYHGVALQTNRTIWAWGRSSGLGLGDTRDRYTPSQIGVNSDWSTVAAGADYTLALKTNRTLWAWGSNNNGDLGFEDGNSRDIPTQVGIETDWSVIAAFSTHSLGIRLNGVLWAWGSNGSGQLGLGDNTDRNVPTLVGE
jgi:alpha-tubulin suppressor-like RCC1 family protein